jgi:hypothetical protein
MSDMSVELKQPLKTTLPLRVEKRQGRPRSEGMGEKDGRVKDSVSGPKYFLIVVGERCESDARAMRERCESDARAMQKR